MWLLKQNQSKHNDKTATPSPAALSSLLIQASSPLRHIVPPLERNEALAGKDTSSFFLLPTSLFLLPAIFFSLIFFLSSCKPSLPKGVLSEGKMVEVLYDYHLAQTMPAQYDPDSKELVRQDNFIYMQAVFKKHGITEAEFDSSMVFYCGDMKRLNNIFKRVAMRLERDASALGVTTGPRDVYAGLKAFGDTANVWAGRNLFAVKSNQLENLQSWQIRCDSSWLPSDDVMWRFDCAFLVKEGLPEVYAELVVRYANDSVRSSTVNLTHNTQCQLKVSTDSMWVPRQINGTLFMPIDPQMPSSRICIVAHPMLVRFHDPRAKSLVPAKSDAVQQPDSLVTDSLAVDSVELEYERLSPEQRRSNQQSSGRINVVKKKDYRRPTGNARRRVLRR